MAYSRLLRAYYRREKPIPLDPGETFRLVRAVTAAQKKAVSTVLEEFFQEGDDGWHNKRADEEIARAQIDGEANKERREHEKERQKRHRDRRQNLFAGLREHGITPPWDASTEELQNALIRVTSQDSHAPVTRDEHVTNNGDTTASPLANNQEPRTKNQKETTEEVAVLPSWLPSENWKAWLEVRRKKGAPNTPRALKLALVELERLKSLAFDPAEVLDQSTLKGWKALYPIKAAVVALTQEPAGKLCDYCPKVHVGTVNGRRHCGEHGDLAMDNEKPTKIAA